MAYKDKNDPRRKAAHLKWYYKNKEKQVKQQADRKVEIACWFADLKKNLKCENCGENHIGCLDFHHVDASQKEGAVSRMVGEGWSQERITAEIQKCQVLCSNCHRKWHYENDRRRTD